MDEDTNTGDGLSWRAKLAKANINILHVEQNIWYIEFTYHPRPGVFKWCKTIIRVPFWPYADDEVEDAELINTQHILDTVLKLRKELED